MIENEDRDITSEDIYYHLLKVSPEYRTLDKDSRMTEAENILEILSYPTFFKTMAQAEVLWYKMWYTGNAGPYTLAFNIWDNGAIMDEKEEMHREEVKRRRFDLHHAASPEAKTLLYKAFDHDDWKRKHDDWKRKHSKEEE